MRICIISMHPVAGFKSFLVNVSQLLMKNGCDVTILFLDRNSRISISGISERMYELPEHSGKNESLFLMRQIYKKIEYRLKRISNAPQVELKNNLFHSQIRALRKAKNCNPKLELSDYDCVISAEEIQCNYFLAFGVHAKLKIGYIHPDYLKTPYDRKIDEYALRELDYICATSKINAESIRAAIPAIKNKVIGVPNPIDIDYIIQRAEGYEQLAFQHDRINLITVCRLDNTYKALDRLLLIAKKLMENGDQFVWRIIGWGDYESIMKMSIEEYGLREHVIMTGPYDNPIPFIKASDLFVLQSYSEGYPMSVCEAIAVNTPVLVTSYPSAYEQVEDQITGFIVDNDTESIYDKIHQLIINPGLLHSVKNKLEQYDKSKLSSIEPLLGLIR